MFDLLHKNLTTLFIKPYLSWYLKTDREINIKGFKLLIKSGVFHPGFFFSTDYLFDFLNTKELEGNNFLEIGCGSGLISLLAYKKKARVTSTDINPTAIECTQLNFTKNFSPNSSDFKCIESDLFSNIPLVQYDIIVINPPYFFEDVTHEKQLAWNCGKNGEYFKKLFSSLKLYIHMESEVFMILADNCDIKRIQEIAGESGFSFQLIEKKKIRWETNFIFKIT